MCKTIVWALNAYAFTEQFAAGTDGRLAVAPQDTPLRIKSSRVRSGAALRAGTRHVQLLQHYRGRGRQRWQGRYRETLNVWSPEVSGLLPQRARGITMDELDEAVLRRIEDNELLTIDFPKPGAWRE